MTLRLRKMSDLNRKRTLKALFTHTQGYPYPATLDADFDRTAGQLAGGGAVTGSSCAILPGSVMTKLDAENVTLSGATAGRRAFGLAAHFVGGDLDELGDSDSIGVWRGVGSTYLLRAPAFSDTGLAAAEAAEDGDAADEVYLVSGADGRLVFDTAANPTADFATAKVPVARLMKRHSSTAIEIELLV
jgi:hypothetical protein